MTIIRHLCNNREYRYNTATGAVTNNCGTHVTNVLICKLTGIALLYGVTAHWPAIYAGQDAPVASNRHASDMDDAVLGMWAIGHTATIFPED